MQLTKEQQKTRDALNKLLLVGVAGTTATGATIVFSDRADAIDIATVNTDITSIITNTDTTADVA